MKPHSGQAGSVYNGVLHGPLRGHKQLLLSQQCLDRDLRNGDRPAA
jgi:hypothetical protein